MTRREREILIASVSWTDKSLTVNEEKAFQAGARWADKTMIEKALDWLKDITLDYIQGDVRDFDFYSFEKDFRKAMEE